MASSHHGGEVDFQKEKKSLCLYFTGIGAYGCLYRPVFLNLIRHANLFSKYTDVRGPPDLRAVAHICIIIPSCGLPDLHAAAVENH